MSYPDVMDAVRRIALQNRNKENIAKANQTKVFARNQALLYESILHYLDIHAKRQLQRPDREEIPQGVNLPIRGGKECPITGYR